jgi:DNA mismatch repair protein MutS
MKRPDNSLLERNVVKIITPGTLIEPLHTEANYLLSVAISSSSTVGLAWADISTADIKVSALCFYVSVIAKGLNS